MEKTDLVIFKNLRSAPSAIISFAGIAIQGGSERVQVSADDRVGGSCISRDESNRDSHLLLGEVGKAFRSGESEIIENFFTILINGNIINRQRDFIIDNGGLIQ